MPRRPGFSFGPKRKSFKAGGMKINTKGLRVTSTSVGGKNFRVNLSGRGVRTTARIPGTNIRLRSSGGGGRRARATSVATTAQLEQKRGCLRGCFPVLLVVVILLIVLAVV